VQGVGLVAVCLQCWLALALAGRWLIGPLHHALNDASGVLVGRCGRGCMWHLKPVEQQTTTACQP
jgi:hypothetical protein